MKHYETKNCIACGKPATTHLGHVHKENEVTITAGWCDTHRFESDLKKRLSPVAYCRGKTGCLGKYKPKMGLQEYVTHE